MTALALVGCSGGDGGAERDAGPIPGVETFTNLSPEHVTTPVSYPQDPPVGGDHSAQLQPCGAYRQPVAKERAVHSMEHGAVWVTYRPDLPPADINRLNDLAEQTYVLVSPYPGLPAPVVASAWGVQLRLDSATDPRLKRFVAAYRQGPQTPEPGAPCPQVQGG